jgi:MFS family permease
MFDVKIRRIIKCLREEFSFVHGNVLVLIVSWILMTFSRPIPDTYYSLFVQELGGTPFIIGLIGFTSFIALALVQFPGGYLADKYGRRWLIVTMTFGVGLAHIFYALAQSWHYILVGAIIFNLCLIYQPALHAIMADSLPSERRGMGFSIERIVGVFSVVSPLIAGFLYINYGLVEGVRIAYWIVVIAFLLAAIIRLKLRETVDVNIKKLDLVDVMRCYPTAIRESVNVWKLILRTMLYLFSIHAVASFFAQMCGPYYVVYATKVLSIEEVQWSLLIALQQACYVLLASAHWKNCRCLRKKKALVMIHFITMLAIPFFIYGDFTKLIVFFTLSGICNSMFVAYQSLEADLVPREHRGKVIGFTQFFEYILASIGQLLGGYPLRESLASIAFSPIFSINCSLRHPNTSS